MRRALPILPVRIAFIALLVVASLGALGAFRVSLVEDITALLPDRNEGDASLIGMARRWGLMRKVVVVLGPDETSSKRLHRAVDAVAFDLANFEGVDSVFSRVESSEARKAAEIMMDRAFRLYRPKRAAIGPGDVTTRLNQLKDRLAAPESMVMQLYLLQDPLGFARGALRGLEAAGDAMGATAYQGHLVSRDRRFALIIAEIDFKPLDVSRARRFVADLDQVIDRSLERVNASDLGRIRLGGVHFAASSSGAIISDVKMAFVLTFICVVAIFLLFFRRVRLLPAALLPGGIGIAVAMGVMGLAGVELHALTLGFAATITGISVDYAIHLLHRAGTASGDTTFQRMRNALDAVWRPVLLGCLTTFGAFLLVATSRFTGIRQLALFAAISVPVAMIVTLLGLPAFHGFLLGAGPGRDSAGAMRVAGFMSHGRGGRGGRIIVVPVFFVILILGLWWGFRVPLSGDPRDLGGTDADLERQENRLREVFPGLADQAFLIASAETMEEALQANDALYDRLLEAGVKRESMVSVSPFLPSYRTQDRSLAEAKKLLSTSDTARRFVEAGFKKDYLEELKKRLNESPRIASLAYRDTSLWQIVTDAIKRDGNRHLVLTRVRSSDEVALHRLEDIAASVDGCRLVSERLETRAALTGLQKELGRMLVTWLVLALVLLSLIERSVLFGLKAAIPAVFGVAVAVGLFGLIGRPLTAVASAGVTLVMGLGIDYGIFMQHSRSGSSGRTASAVLASALTTIAAFGVLTLAKTRAMADLGLIILVGVSAAMVAALVLLPVLGGSRGRKEEK